MKIIFRIYQWLIAAPIMILITILACIFSLLVCLISGHKYGGYIIPRLWSRAVCALAFVRVKVNGTQLLDKQQAYVFVANHQSAFDIWAIYGYLGHNFKWLMKKSLEKVPMVGFTCKTVGHVFVDDSTVAGIKSTIEDAKKMLRQGMSLVIFPEGTRSHDGKMSPFKRGAFMLASEFGVPVVPITIDGAFERMSRDSYNITPGTITITIHQPIEPTENGFNTKRLMTECRTAINSALPSHHKDESV